jgi:hypothetical protein
MADHTADLHFGKTEIFFRTGLDRANQLDPLQQIGFYAQILEARRPNFSRDTA